MEKEITSVNNLFVKNVVKLQQKKYRDESERFLIEGFKAIEEAHRAGIDIENLFVEDKNACKYSFIKDKIIVTNEAVLKKISTTSSAPDAVAIGVQKKFGI